MKKERVLTQQSFNQLLNWLNPDRELAGRRYEEIRSALIKMFLYRGSSFAEELADETINRVVSKLDEIIDTYVGDPSFYFYSVAHHIFMESLRRKPNPVLNTPVETSEEEDKDKEFDCLEKCLGSMDPKTRELVLEYYKEDKQIKIDHRKTISERLGITPHTLRMRMHRIRGALKKCILDCLGHQEENQKQEA